MKTMPRSDKKRLVTEMVIWGAVAVGLFVCMLIFQTNLNECYQYLSKFPDNDRTEVVNRIGMLGYGKAFTGLLSFIFCFYVIQLWGQFKRTPDSNLIEATRK